MSQQRLRWFVGALPIKETNVPSGEPMLLTRREAIAGCGGGLAVLMGLPALAQTAYPSRTIKMIVPYPAGGTTDFLGRLVADQL
jgi:hypothetical protein